MKDMFERMKEDEKYNAAIRLAFCSLFVVFALIFIGVSNIRNYLLMQKYGNVVDTNNNESIEKETYLIELPTDYTYKYELLFNSKKIIYNGSVNSDVRKVDVLKDDKQLSYVYLNDNYYLEDGDNLTKVSLEDIYDIISYDYFDIDNINNYINKIQNVDNKHLVYVKDINSDVLNDEYITFYFEENRVIIDYTNLIKLSNEEVENCTLSFEYSGKE